MFTKLGEKIKAEIKAKGIRPIIIESFFYSQQYGVGGVFTAIGLLLWNWYSSEEQYARILSHQFEIEKWNQKIDDRARKIILTCESIKTAKLVQAYRDTGKEQVDKSSTRAYEVFLDSLRQESQDKKGELLVLTVDGEKDEEEEKGGGGDGSEEFGGVVALLKGWFPLPWEYRNQDQRGVHMALPQCARPPPAQFIPPKPVGVGPFLSPAPVSPSAGSMGYDMPKFFYVPQMSPIIIRAPQLPLYFPLVDPSLPLSMVKQIEYYFSDANLVKDDFLRSKMDEEGWVPIELIADLPGVKKFIDSVQVTDAVQLILYFLSSSTLVEVQDKKLRRQDDWRKWIHTSGRFTADSGSSAPVASTDSSLQNVSSVESISSSPATDAQVVVAADGGLSDKSANQSKPAQEEGSAEGISSNHT